jgi:uncharacterized membrane protein YfcA
MQEFILFVVVGFLAQLVDGALGMAYGVISSTTLLAFGVSPAQASAAVHGAEIFTTAASGSAHLYHRNIDWKLFVRLVPFGIGGGCLGAYVLTAFEGDMIKPYITTYLTVVGAWLLIRSFRKIPHKSVPASIVAPLGFAGGFLDAVGGGGWGPTVSTGLLGAGGAPRYVIGTVNTSEFLVTTAISAAFFITLLPGHWRETGDLTEYLAAVGGLVTGGLMAAPFAGFIVKSLPEQMLLRAVGTLIVCLAAYQTLDALGIIGVTPA